MQRAEILVAAWRRERVREGITGVECLRLEQSGARGDGVRYVVVVAPGDGRACLDPHCLRLEREVVDPDLRLLGARHRRDYRERDGGGDAQGGRAAARDVYEGHAGLLFQLLSG